jgi:hypothetical protein
MVGIEIVEEVRYGVEQALPRLDQLLNDNLLAGRRSGRGLDRDRELPDEAYIIIACFMRHDCNSEKEKKQDESPRATKHPMSYYYSHVLLPG